MDRPTFICETEEEIAASNAELINALNYGDPESFSKEASAASTNMIRRRIRENGFLRNIIPPKPKTAEDCDRSLESVQQRIIEDMEPHSRGAVTLSFNDAADSDVIRVAAMTLWLLF
jgi:hypothetical protein